MKLQIKLKLDYIKRKLKFTFHTVFNTVIYNYPRNNYMFTTFKHWMWMANFNFNFILNSTFIVIFILNLTLNFSFNFNSKIEFH